MVLIALDMYGQSVDSVIVFDFKKRCDPFFSSKKTDATFCHFYISEKADRSRESHANDKFGDSLLFSYYGGCDCSKTIRSERIRGGCESWQEMEYIRKKQSYKMKTVLFRESFRTWESGFDSNLVKDSIRKPQMLRNRKIPTEKLETFLREITSIYSDTVFSYQLSEVPEKIRKKDNWSEENRDSLQIDSSIRSSLNTVTIVSSAITHFTISFQLGGKEYELYKNAGNPYWRIYSPGNEEKGKSFIYFALDAFLYGGLSKKFAGRRTLNQ